MFWQQAALDFTEVWLKGGSRNPIAPEGTLYDGKVRRYGNALANSLLLSR